jgi:hypothetical protein
LAEELNDTHAGERLHICQSAASKQIAELESSDTPERFHESDIVEATADGIAISIYSDEKMLAHCFKYRNACIELSICIGRADG